ncbi:MAG: hypothetical protein QG622_1219 [Actinomycetota bacterium]|nr:hypothetical protein [Actinomycetota bacterium]
MSILTKVATSKVARVTAITALVGGTMIGLTTSSAQAATALTLSPATSDAAGGAVIAVKGSGLADATNAPKVLAATFSTTVCNTTTVSGTAAASFAVESATVAYVTTPVLAANTWYLCLYDVASGAGNLLGQGTLVTAAAPTVTSIAPVAPAAPVKGGTSITLTGTNYTKATKVLVDGVAAKTTYVSATSLLAVLPAHAAQKDVPVKVVSEYASVTTAADANYVDYFPSITVTPASGNGGANQWITVKGSGFNALTFGAAATNQVVTLVPGGTTLTAATTVILTATKPCATLIRVSDTQLSCLLPTPISGAYSVMIIARDGTTAANYGSTTIPIMKTGTYTAASM